MVAEDTVALDRQLGIRDKSDRPESWSGRRKEEGVAAEKAWCCCDCRPPNAGIAVEHAAVEQYNAG